ncbi:hypothetical protein UY3_12316 [Chelonia mydas]|uniref:Uncharacterized protein n=1 Tax=Chelonia mydas TaxID=8469 RepID=M7AYE7_CHEMY|nr:hypothetical protein UY3_12316 [Chelonia mydas]
MLDDNNVSASGKIVQSSNETPTKNEKCCKKIHSTKYSIQDGSIDSVEHKQMKKQPNEKWKEHTHKAPHYAP